LLTAGNTKVASTLHVETVAVNITKDGDISIESESISDSENEANLIPTIKRNLVYEAQNLLISIRKRRD